MTKDQLKAQILLKLESALRLAETQDDEHWKVGEKTWAIDWTHQAMMAMLNGDKVEV